MVSLYRVHVIKKLRAKERKHTVLAYNVVATNDALARNAVDFHARDALLIEVKRVVAKLTVDLPHVIGGPDVYLRDKDTVNASLGIEKPAPKASKSRKNAPLGESQWHMLNSLHEYGPWVDGCGWLWNTSSGTKRILDGLVRRELVSLSDDGRYHLAAAGRQKLIDRANAAAYHGVDND